MMIDIIIVKREHSMRISKAQAQENRQRVVDTAAKLFREKGFDGVAVADLMRAAGMTHGGFYNHFDSKEELEAAACEHVFQRSLQRLGAVASIEEPEARQAAFDSYRMRYVSKEARDKPAPACPMVAFAGDMSRRSPEIRKAYSEGLAAYLKLFAAAAGAKEGDAEARSAALREYATLAGALILARGVAQDDPGLSEEILRAAGGEP